MRTELIVAPDPLILRHAVGWMPLGSRLAISTSPPAWHKPWAGAACVVTLLGPAWETNPGLRGGHHGEEWPDLLEHLLNARLVELLRRWRGRGVLRAADGARGGARGVGMGCGARQDRPVRPAPRR